jgi:hypothetical protein
MIPNQYHPHTFAALHHFDVANQVRLRGTAAATNFALSDYRADLAEYHKMQQVLVQM